MNALQKISAKITLSKRNWGIAAATALLVLIVGYYMVATYAAGFFIGVSPAKGTISGNAKIVTEADGTKSLLFNAPSTPPPTPPPTTPPPTTPPPATGAQSCPPYPAFPNADCTGVPNGTQLTVVNGDVTLETAGMVYDAKDVRGTMYVRANNITIKRTKAKNGIQIRAWEGISGLVIEDSEIGPDSGSGGDDGVAFYNYTCRRCDIHGFSDGAKVNGNVLIEDSWIHGLYQKSGDHNDGLQNHGGGGNVTIRHSNIDVRPSNVSDKGNAAIFMADNPTGTMTVDNNLLAGGQYTLQFLDSDGYTVIARGNHFVRSSYALGTHRLHPNGNNVTWENNVFSDNGQQIAK